MFILLLFVDFAAGQNETHFGDDFIRETRLFASNRKMAGIGNCCIYDINAIHCCTMNYTECYNYSTNDKIENTGYSFDSYNFTCPYEWDSSGIGQNWDGVWIFFFLFIFIFAIAPFCCLVISVIVIIKACGCCKPKRAQQEQTTIINQTQFVPNTLLQPGTVIQMQQTQ